MRLQLTCAACLLGVAAAAAAHAEPGAQATLRVYTDDDGMTVVSPAVAAEAEVRGAVLAADATADAVSGASVDVVTAASPTAIDERRVELGLRAGHAVPRWPTATLTVEARGSHENDHDSLQGGGAARAELWHRRLTLDARYFGGREVVGSAVDAGFRGVRRSHLLATSASVVLGPRSIVDVVAEARTARGYHGSPYRRVPWVDPAWPLPTWLDEQLPDRRRSIAATVRLRRAIGARWFAAGAYGAYRDDWDLTSHTLAADARRQLGERVLVGAALRGYTQRGASFYRATYDGAMPALRTRDRVLGPMRTLFASVAADVVVDPARDWHAIVAAGVLGAQFPDFPLQRGRNALMLTVSVTAPLGAD